MPNSFNWNLLCSLKYVVLIYIGMDATKTEPQINLKICSAGVFLVASCVVKGHEQPDYNCVHKCRKELKWQFKNVHTSEKKKKKSHGFLPQQQVKCQMSLLLRFTPVFQSGPPCTKEQNSLHMLQCENVATRKIVCLPRGTSEKAKQRSLSATTMLTVCNLQSKRAIR